MCPEETHVEPGNTSSDAEELREIFDAIAGFIKQIKAELKELFMMSFEALNGDKLGEEVAKFYSSLIKKGVPKELAEKMTMEFFHKRLEAVPDLGKLLSGLKLLGSKKAGTQKQGGIKPGIIPNTSEENKKEREKGEHRDEK